MDKALTRLCLEIIANIRSDLSEDDLRSIGYPTVECPIQRRLGDDGWYGTVKPPAGHPGFDRPVRVHAEIISGLAIEALIRQMDAKPPVKERKLVPVRPVRGRKSK